MKALNTLQGDNIFLGDCFEQWLQLYDACPDHFKHFVAQRRDRYLTPVFLAAYLLDHRYEGRKLDPEDTKLALSYIKSIGANAMANVAMYMNREEPYLQECFDDFRSVAPASWWKMGKRLGFDDSLVQVAMGLVPRVPNSAGLERCFSAAGKTYGKLRTQMDVEKCGKLAFLYREMNQV